MDRRSAGLRLFWLISIAAAAIAIMLIGCDKDSAVQNADSSGTIGLNPAFEYISGCISDSKRQVPSDIDYHIDRLEYSYGDDRKLHIAHYNTVFNCCPALDLEFHARNDTLFISEIEVKGGCRCLCLFDLLYVIRSVSIDTRTIVVNEPHIKDDLGKMVFPVDFRQSPSGYFEIERDHYPWGY